jgi:hypothetical protein
VARLPADAPLLDRANTAARAILEADPELTQPEHVLLDDAMHAKFGADALEPIPA